MTTQTTSIMTVENRGRCVFHLEEEQRSQGMSSDDWCVLRFVKSGCGVSSLDDFGSFLFLNLKNKSKQLSQRKDRVSFNLTKSTPKTSHNKLID